MAPVKTPFASDRVRDVFSGYPITIQSKLLSIRELIFATAAANPIVGALEETLKWSEPAYLTSQSRSGSTIRIAWHVRAPRQFGVYFNCRTSLLNTARTLFPNLFTFSGNRGIIFRHDEPIPDDALRVCIETALTYHTNKHLSTAPKV